MTWALVSTRPSSEMTTPEPARLEDAAAAAAVDLDA